MTSSQALEWLGATQQFGVKLGLDNTRQMLFGLKSPEKKLSFIHVAGTNGKGSVCAMMDAISRASGRRTGLYTSPHLVDFRERIRVEGEMISHEALRRILSTIREICDPWEHTPTYFEIATVLALKHFAEEGCELVILETGMGGRLDATNVVTPLASVITPIALDHAEWLGSTLGAIAREKAGIIKTGVPVVSARQEPEVREVLVEAARMAAAPLTFVDQPFEQYPLRLAGEFQKINAAVAVVAIAVAGLRTAEESIQQGLARVRWPGRFQIVRDRIVLDGSHNPHAAVQLVANWRARFGEEKPILIFGALADKDYAEMLRLVGPLSDDVLLVPVRNGRSLDPEELQKHRPTGRIFRSLEAALDEALPRPGRILIAGSLFLVGEAMELLGLDP